MNLLSKLRDKRASKIATATPATVATYAGGERQTVACVATVAVASSKQERAVLSTSVDIDDAASAIRWCSVHYAGKDPLEVACYPQATHAEILKQHPDAVMVQPLTSTVRQPSARLTPGEETQILAWLSLIEETDPATIAEVIGQCQKDADVRDYFTRRAAADLPRPAPIPDDRRTCDQCANLIARRCQAAKRGEIVASRNFEPIPDLPRRCEGYAPRTADPDQRHGRQRWPGLFQKGGE